MEKCASEESDIGEGVCTRAPAQGHHFSASKDIFNALAPLMSAQNVNSTRQGLSLLSARTTSPPQILRQTSKQAPSKQADLQVQAFELSRESRSRGTSPCIKDILSDRGFERRLSKSVDGLRSDVSGDSRREAASEQGAYQVGHNPTRINEALMEVLDVRVAELSQKLMGFLSDVIDSRVEARLAALETQAAQRTSYDNEMAKNMGEEICAMGSQINTLNSRISKITSRPAVRIEHITALEERVIALDRSLSELRCEYLEGCLRSHQMEELLIALHSNVRDIRATQSESKQTSSSDNSSSDSARKHAGSHPSAGRLETISEVPIDESPEEASPEDEDQPPVPEGHPEDEPSALHSPETVAAVTDDCTAPESDRVFDCHVNADKVKGDLVAPELAIEPHTPDDEMQVDNSSAMLY